MIPYQGGKYKLANWIIENFPKNYKDMVYVEPFGGAGWVLFFKEKSRQEIYNDLNNDLVNMFIQIRDNYSKFKKKVQWILHSKKEFEIAKEKVLKRNFTDDLDRAVSYAVYRVQSFSGSGLGWKYRKDTNPEKPAWFLFLKRLAKIRQRLQTVQIENRDYKDIIKRYDSPNTLFYIDPPYLEKEKIYEILFTEHEELASLLKTIKGKFVLSYFEHPEILNLYKDFIVERKERPLDAVYSRENSKQKPKAVEILIKNFPNYKQNHKILNKTTYKNKQNLYLFTGM